MQYIVQFNPQQENTSSTEGSTTPISTEHGKAKVLNEEYSV